jgi:hypothetical protein
MKNNVNFLQKDKLHDRLGAHTPYFFHFRSSAEADLLVVLSITSERALCAVTRI